MRYFFTGPSAKPHTYGLPGGHLEADDDPEAAVHRELVEEVGLDIATNLVKRTFWIHEGGKVVLAFTGTPTTTALPEPPRPSEEIAQWIEIDSLTTENIGSYLPFIKHYQPTT
jgi:8-oxo-dGTP pyrophosphatase MutT (NUDIX family)